MTDNKNYTEVFEAQSAHPTSSRERAMRASRRVKRRKKGVSKLTRYAVSALIMILVFLLAFYAGSLMIKIFNPPAPSQETEDDPITTLQKRLDELTSENRALTEDINELKAKLDKYNEIYGPIDSQMNPSENTNTNTDSSDSSEPFAPESPSDITSTGTPEVTAPVVNTEDITTPEVNTTYESETTDSTAVSETE